MSDLAALTCEALHDCAALRIAKAETRPTEHERSVLVRALELSEWFLRQLETIPQEQRRRTRSSFEFNPQEFVKAVTFHLPAASGAGSTARGLLRLAGVSISWPLARPRAEQRQAEQVYPSDDARERLPPYAMRLTHAATHVLAGALAGPVIEIRRGQPAWLHDDAAAPRYPLALHDGSSSCRLGGRTRARNRH